MGNLTFFQQKFKKLGQFFQIEKLLDKFYVWIFRNDWIFNSYFALLAMGKYLAESPLAAHWHSYDVVFMFCVYWVNSIYYYPTVYIRSNCLFFAMSWVTELFHRSINMTIDWHYTMGLVSRFPVKNTQALIIMRDDDARTVRLWKETLFNNGENEAWFGNFKLK